MLRLAAHCVQRNGSSGATKMELQPIQYEVGGKSFTGYLADGSNGRPCPGVLVAHEGGGLTDHAKERARMLADLGRVAFAMDYYGQTGLPIAEAQVLLRELRDDLETLRARVRAAFEIVSRHRNVEARRRAAIGFCFGGQAVLELAREGAPVAVTVGFHAALTTSRPAAPGAIEGKVLVCHGADDPIIGAADREAFVAEMTAAKADWQMLLLGGVAHSFTNRDIDALGYPGFAYDATADRRSWKAMRDLFDETLGPVAG
jgi:dienelactone hydrolase